MIKYVLHVKKGIKKDNCIQSNIMMKSKLYNIFFFWLQVLSIKSVQRNQKSIHTVNSVFKIGKNLSWLPVCLHFRICCL